MLSEIRHLNIKDEVDLLADCVNRGDPEASHHLARLIEADTMGIFQPFAEALTARLRDELQRWAELGVTDPDITLDGEVYHLLKTTAVDWDGFLHKGRPGEEA